MTLKNKKILIIIGGGISAYKSLDLIRLLKKNGNEVKAILTKSGKEFVTPLSVSTLTKSKTFENIFDKDSEVEIDHISLSRWADLIIVLPTTANFMTKLSLGKAEDLATTVILASNKDILLVPAMNVRMWMHKATQQNFKILKDYGYLFIGPEKGEMACGEFGEGKMSSPRQIYSFIEKYFNKKNIIKSKNLKALVTAGPTREYLDPVRYISNESSGKQGFEIAEALSRLGIKTTLITGPSHLSSRKNIKTKKIITADEMFEAVKKCLPVDIAICTAAVADFKPMKKSKIKIKKDNINFKSIEFERSRDIVEFLGKNNKHRPSLVIGFAAETENLNKNAFSKLKQKNCDLIVVNDVSKKDSGFNSDYNRVTIIDNSGKTKVIKKNKKSFIANVIAEIVLDKILINDRSFN
ncbi:MAG: bifunctional phosphopantothenoylcysteine decarboxylase/phosphopantothenate--cysteine ligase CoaBC [Pseudomonadota bacterium]|nr:bifunctional phosphopantothenoylcysteine decarboxylase/phosphopantothenate--cysteine ligase CoaBC [Pseudomonadota bacterium]